jgi:hypothetical protein
MDLPHLILEMSNAEQWTPAPHAGRWARAIPPTNRPTILQQDRETAEKEALRLAGAHPGKRFVVFAPIAAGVTAKVPTHVSIDGQVILERNVPALASIDDPNEIPF